MTLQHMLANCILDAKLMLAESWYSPVGCSVNMYFMRQSKSLAVLVLVFDRWI